MTFPDHFSGLFISRMRTMIRFGTILICDAGSSSMRAKKRPKKNENLRKHQVVKRWMLSLVGWSLNCFTDSRSQKFKILFAAEVFQFYRRLARILKYVKLLDDETKHWFAPTVLTDWWEASSRMRVINDSPVHWLIVKQASLLQWSTETM